MERTLSKRVAANSKLLYVLQRKGNRGVTREAYDLPRELHDAGVSAPCRAMIVTVTGQLRVRDDVEAVFSRPHILILPNA